MRFKELPPRLQAYLAAHGIVLVPLGYELLHRPFAVDAGLTLLLVLCAGGFSVSTVDLVFFQLKLTPTFAVVTLAMLVGGLYPALLCAMLGALISTHVRLSQDVGRVKLQRQPVYRTLFNVANCGLSCWISTRVFEAAQRLPLPADVAGVVGLALFTSAYFLVNTGGVALAVSLLQGRSWRDVWRDNFGWTWLSYLASASLAGGVKLVFDAVHAYSLFLLAPLYLVTQWQRLYIDRLRLLSEKADRDAAHIEELSRQNHDLHELNRAVIAESPLATIAISQDMTVRIWNAAAERLFGWSPDETLGRPLPLGAVDTRENPSELLQRALHGESVSDVETVVRTRAGRPVEVSFSVAPLENADGAVTGATAVVVDITDRKRAEEALREQHLRTLIADARDVICLLAEDGKVRYVSPSVERMLGYTPDEALGKRVLQLIHHDDAPAVLAQFRDTVQDRRRRLSGECRIRRRSGEWRRVQFTGSSHLGEATVGGIVVTLRDVTEQRLLEEQLRQSQKLEAVGRLAGGVAHDFNNMLSVINGYSDLLLQRLAADDGSAASIREIRNAGERAATLTRQLLAFSRKQILAPQVLRLNLVVRDMERMLRRLVGEDTELVTRLQPDLGLVRADRGQIEQVIVHLVVNARDAMPQGGQIAVETSEVELEAQEADRLDVIAAGRYVRLSVIDNGIGIDPVTLSHIFEPFFTTKETGKGSGLGLAMVYGIVKQSGGHVEVSSELAEGTRFDVCLPCLAGVDERSPAAVSPSQQASPTVLLVEDEILVRRMVRQMLEGAGYRVLEADGPDAALRTAAEYDGPIGVLLTDVVMPQGSGRALAEQLRQLRPATKVVYMTGYSDEVLDRHGVSEGADPLIEKPFSAARLAQVLRDALGAS